MIVKVIIIDNNSAIKLNIIITFKYKIKSFLSLFFLLCAWSFTKKLLGIKSLAFDGALPRINLVVQCKINLWVGVTCIYFILTIFQIATQDLCSTKINQYFFLLLPIHEKPIVYEQQIFLLEVAACLSAWPCNTQWIHKICLSIFFCLQDRHLFFYW